MSRLPSASLLLLLLAPLAVLQVAILAQGGGFTYTLDDPYIHLALARNISAGHYGINAGEWSSPSSSIVWPYILAPFAPFAGYQYVPLGLNFVLTAAALVVLHTFVRQQFDRPVAAAFDVLCLAIGTNLYGLAFTGLEHSLQVLLAIIITTRYCRGKLDRVFWGALVLLPLVRYEGFAVSLPLCAYAWHAGFRRASLGAAVAMITACGGFSLFLLMHGLPPLPSSVIAKSDLKGLATIGRNVVANIGDQPALFLLVLALTVYLFRTRRQPECLVLLSSAVLFYAFGKCGGFGRYEVFFLMFVQLQVVYWWMCAWHGTDRVHDARWMLRPAVWSLVCFTTLPMVTLCTPRAAANIHDQQVQMGEIVSRLAAPVAVNDLGVVSLRAKAYVLDLWGLGSFEALSLRKTEPGFQWLDGLMGSKNVELAFVYDSWITSHPPGWIRVGELVLPGRRITPASDVVSLYATNEAAASRLREVLHQYRASSPLAGSITRIF